MKKIKTFKFKTQRNPVKMNLPSLPQISANEDEPLTGQVQGMQASAGEENLARAYDELGFQYYFRHVVGAPKGLPGWKELDFLVLTKGMLYAVEVDTAFTHRNKEYADVLHDAIILNDRELNSYGTLYPQVFHVDGEQDLSNKNMARAYVRRTFGKG